jgi:heme-degrading monooxygenase HmoA
LNTGLKVKDYEQWKKAFDAHIEQRKAAGEISFQVFRKMDDPNTLTVLTIQESEERVREFLGSSDLKQAMEESGVIEVGPFLFLEEVDSSTH